MATVNVTPNLDIPADGGVLSNCKHCRKLISKEKVLCVKCFSLFHPGCVKFALQAKNPKCNHEWESSPKIVCNNSEVETEIMYLKELVSVLKSKNNVLEENCALLREKNLYLQSEIMSLKQQRKCVSSDNIIVNPLSTSAKTLKHDNENGIRNAWSAKVNNDTININETISTVSKSSFGHQLENYQTSLMNDIINLDPISTKDDMNISSMEGTDFKLTDKDKTKMVDVIQDDGFKKVIHNKKKVNIIKGKLEGGNLTFKAAIKKRYIYVGNLSLDCKSNAIQDYLMSKFPERNFEVEQLPKRDSARSIAFKITVDEDMFNKLLCEDIWPSGVVIKKFHFFRSIRKDPAMS
ncbi:hypothetical protein Zmor_008712 [Zophobas morio]|uniref:Uncharacterized protein n=1 Tax=Zophobas morio TaxID=2755281 RepID=A0AA38HK52_9CUCU|nr:hypothetical protein Zmor_008712 [Zophobas morio]